MVTAALFFENEVYVNRNGIVPKLERIGITVKKKVHYQSSAVADLSSCDICILFLANATEGSVANAEHAAAMDRKRSFRITHQKTAPGWQALARYVEEVRSKTPAIEATSGSPAMATPPLVLRIVPPSHPNTGLVLPTSRNPDDDWEVFASQLMGEVEAWKKRTQEAELSLAETKAAKDKAAIDHGIELHATADKLRKVTDSLNAERKFNKESVEQKVSVDTNLSVTTKELNAARATITNQTAELTKLKATMVRMQDENDGLTIKNGELQEELEKLASDNEDLGAKLADMLKERPPVPPTPARKPVPQSVIDNLEGLVKSGALSFAEALGIALR